MGTPLLYANMVVHTDRLNKDFKSTLLDPGNHRGLAHIRTLRVNTEHVDEEFDYFEEGDITSAICSLLAAIPENALSRFE